MSISWRSICVRFEDPAGMSKRKIRTQKVMESLASAGSDEKCDVLRELCPCRNQVRDVEVWHEVFRVAREGGARSRNRASHAIATLMQRAQGSPRWRELLQSLQNDLDRLWGDPRASNMLAGQVAHNAEHAKKLRKTPAAIYRYQTRVLDLATPEELAAWVNERTGLRRHEGVSPKHPGIQRLARWLEHRVTFHDHRKTDPDEFLEKAQRWLPEYLGEVGAPPHKKLASR